MYPIRSPISPAEMTRTGVMAGREIHHLPHLRKLLSQAAVSGVTVPLLPQLLPLLAGVVNQVHPRPLPLVVVAAGVPKFLPSLAPEEAGPQRHRPLHLSQKEILQFLMPSPSSIAFRTVHRLAPYPRLQVVAEVGLAGGAATLVQLVLPEVEVVAGANRLLARVQQAGAPQRRRPLLLRQSHLSPRATVVSAATPLAAARRLRLPPRLQVVAEAGLAGGAATLVQLVLPEVEVVAGANRLLARVQQAGAPQRHRPLLLLLLLPSRSQDQRDVAEVAHSQLGRFKMAQHPPLLLLTTQPPLLHPLTHPPLLHPPTHPPHLWPLTATALLVQVGTRNLRPVALAGVQKNDFFRSAPFCANECIRVCEAQAPALMKV